MVSASDACKACRTPMLCEWCVSVTQGSFCASLVGCVWQAGNALLANEMAAGQK
jgi:hypothetical protein